MPARTKAQIAAGTCRSGLHVWVEGQRKCLECQRQYNADPKIRAQQQQYRLALEGGFIRVKLREAKKRAKNRGEAFDLTFEQLILVWNEQRGYCALTGVEMTRRVGEGRSPTAASLDRIDPNSIYSKGNVRFVCDRVNQMKNNGTDDELREWCWRILNG